MGQNDKRQFSAESQVTLDEVNRVLEVGRLLLSVLTEEEMEELQNAISSTRVEKLGNTGVT